MWYCFMELSVFGWLAFEFNAMPFPIIRCLVFTRKRILSISKKIEGM